MFIQRDFEAKTSDFNKCAASQTYRVLPTDRILTKDSMIFKLDEFDFLDTAVRLISTEFQKANSRISQKKSSVATGVAVNGLAYLSMNIPDWLKILKEEYRVNHWRDFDEDDFEDDDKDSENWVPPHEFLARQILRTRTASFSLHEGLVIQREFYKSNYRGFMRESVETPFLWVSG
ncbi:Hypothetical predicted protein [Olea europaea subsp. europaea]|uniref:Uncharacterized protein n=1 Tax=Olea europaea subsp. europaea TaxID=158383 RepID=A0A8S0VE27_OLEEU|nr:Hypothetical predicted protein [Olea europaea subsp. europaea]